ncbi:MAG: hypothetical protein K2G38_04395 [Clostridia bacterium]|nr:hypothetical protein [Clostridia bacterium]
MERKEQTNTDELNPTAQDSTNQTYVEITDDSLEKANFSKHTYKIIKRARRKGKLHNIKIPYLQYNLTKSKSRPKIIVMAIFSAIVMLLGFAGAIYTIIVAGLPLIQFSSDSTQAVANIKIPIADLFGGIGVVILWMIVLVLLSVIIAVTVLLVNNTLKLLNISRCPVEEFAYSHEVRDALGSFAGTSFIALFIGVCTLFANSKLGWIIGILIIVIAILFIVSAIILIIERNKARKELENTGKAGLEFIKDYFAGVRKAIRYRTLAQSFFGFGRWR